MSQMPIYQRLDLSIHGHNYDEQSTRYFDMTPMLDPQYFSDAYNEPSVCEDLSSAS